MSTGRSLLPGVVLVTISCITCGGGKGINTVPPPSQVATPTVAISAAQNGAQIISLSDATAGATIYYTLDGTAPTANSTQYLATPFLIASNVILKAMATRTGASDSGVLTRNVAAGVASGSLVWSDEFSNLTGSNAQPDPSVWTYDIGNSGFGNNELETYCAWASTAPPCKTNSPNAYVGNDGYLHVVALHPSNGTYTSARLKTQGLFSYSYGRIEARIQLPEGQGLWPAFWLLGNNISTVNWPACGELDVMEHINAPTPDWIAGSIHGTNLNGSRTQSAASGQSFGTWHVYGMIWSKGQVSYYLDSPGNVYATFTPANTPGTWPFDSGAGAFIILNLAVGGNWPGPPDASTPFPAEMLVDYIRLYTN